MMAITIMIKAESENRYNELISIVFLLLDLEILSWLIYKLRNLGKSASYAVSERQHYRFLKLVCFVFDVFLGLPITAAFLRSKGVFTLKKVFKSGSNCSITIIDI